MTHSKIGRRDFLRAIVGTGAAAVGTALLDGGLAKAAYPPQSRALKVTFLPQVLPGDFPHSMNCGPASCAMVAGFWNAFTPASSSITNSNKYLATKFNDKSYDQPNGNPNGTGFGGRNELGVLLSEYYNLSYQKKYGTSPADVANEIVNGRPVIVGVMISGGQLVSKNGVAHFSVAWGWDNQFHLHNPGSAGGSNTILSIKDFDATWATMNRIYVPVWK